MFIRKLSRSLALLAGVLVLVFSTLPAAAATGSFGGDGLRISPVRTSITINPGQTKDVYVTVTNVQTAPATLSAIINDFTASSNESGNPAIIVNPNQYAPSHSLKRFVKPIKNTIYVAPGASVQVPVSISVPANAAGGGYFGLVRFAPAGDSVSGRNLSLAGSVGSLILLTVPGNIINKMSISSFQVQSQDAPRTLFYSNKNLQAVVRFNNTGNIQEQPFGNLIVKSRSGKELYSTEFNNTQPRTNVLPGSIRKYTIPLKKVGSFGIYTVEGNFGYGSNGQLLTAATTFYVVPLYLIIAFIVLVLIVLFLIFGLPKIIKRYNKRIIARANRNRS